MIWSILLGYAIGSFPSADLVSRLRGYDLRSSGTRNPGAANALEVAGGKAAATVLTIDLAKGVTALTLGNVLGGAGAAIGAGVAAIAGQVLNPWFRFRGGKGLGVAAGVTAAAWPTGVLLVLPVTAVGAKFLRAAGGAILGLATYIVGAGLWAANDWPMWWGIAPDDRLVWLAIGAVALTAPKFVADLLRRRNSEPT